MMGGFGSAVRVADAVATCEYLRNGASKPCDHPALAVKFGRLR